MSPFKQDKSTAPGPVIEVRITRFMHSPSTTFELVQDSRAWRRAFQSPKEMIDHLCANLGERVCLEIMEAVEKTGSTTFLVNLQEAQRIGVPVRKTGLDDEPSSLLRSLPAPQRTPMMRTAWTRFAKSKMSALFCRTSALAAKRPA